MKVDLLCPLRNIERLGLVVPLLFLHKRDNMCKRMQQLFEGPVIRRGNGTTHSTLYNCILQPSWHVRGPKNVGRAVQRDPRFLRHASAVTEQKKCKVLLAQTFDRFQTLRNNSNQQATTCNRVCKRTEHVTSNNVASVARGFLPQRMFYS